MLTPMIMKLLRYIDHDLQMTPNDFQVTRSLGQRYPFIHLGGEEQMWEKMCSGNFQWSKRDSNPGPLDPQASVLPLDHCSHRI
ncbi:hypothetical protein DPMN_154494 [Dreissena polymorpha]|uniref:Uncharacterized protein n=1 Tax=Dreissena polymorpha TaxID=45954 RepID=A0A9D4FMQ4_DREPO|nr:hypothetical protein DPMN_154494 [Dreissena polymorpha]